MSKSELDKEMDGYIVAQGELMRTYSKNGTVNK